MARVQYGVIVTELKGAVAGHVFQGGNVGFVLRSKGFTQGSSSTLRRAANRQLVQVTSGWKSLSGANRAAWAAATGNWPFTDKFGNRYFGSGYQMYVAYNTALISCGYATVTTPAAPITPDPLLSFTISNTTAAGAQYTFNSAAVNPSSFQIFASPPYSAGKNVNHIRYKLMTIEDYTAAGATTFVTDYVALYGKLPVGSQIFLKGVVRYQSFPFAYFPTQISFIVT